jgi:RNA polymerase sigma factor (sigma-70 family)
VLTYPTDAPKEIGGFARCTSVATSELDEIERLYRTRYRAFVAFAAAVAGDAEEATDVVQEAFAAAVRKRRRVQGANPLEAWLWRIVLNKARDRARKGRRTRLVASAETPVSPNGYEADAAVRTLLARLPERQREAIFLRYYADLDYATIAELLGISSGTVGATLSAAHASLRERLQEGRQ